MTLEGTSLTEDPFSQDAAGSFDFWQSHRSIGEPQRVPPSDTLEDIIDTTLAGAVIQGLEELKFNIENRTRPIPISYGQIISSAYTAGITNIPVLLETATRLSEEMGIEIPSGLRSDSIDSSDPSEPQIEWIRVEGDRPSDIAIEEQNKRLLDEIHRLTKDLPRVTVYRGIDSGFDYTTMPQVAPGLRSSYFSLRQLLELPRSILLPSALDETEFMLSLAEIKDLIDRGRVESILEELSRIHKFRQTAGLSPFLSTARDAEFAREWVEGNQGKVIKISVPEILTLDEEDYTYNAPTTDTFDKIISLRERIRSNAQTTGRREISPEQLLSRSLRMLKNPVSTYENELYVVGGIHPSWIIGEV